MKEGKLKFQVKDINLASYGEKEVKLAELEMPGLMALRETYSESQPLKGARIVGCLHMTIQTAVLIETLHLLGAKVSWSSCNIYSTQDHAAAYIASLGIPVYAWKGESEKEYWECMKNSIDIHAETPNMLLDDGGDLTRYVLESGNEELIENIKGVSEETTTGVHQLYKFEKSGKLKFPAINVNDSVTKSKFDNKYGCRESAIDAIRRATDTMISGKRVHVCGYGDVGKGTAASFKSAGAIVTVSEIDPICALQALMDGIKVVDLAEVAKEVDIVVTATGNLNVVDSYILDNLKDGAIVGNIGHFDDEIEVSYLNNRSDIERVEIKPQVDQYTYQESGKRLILLSQGRLMNLGNATGHPSLVMSMSFTNQTLAQIELFLRNQYYERGKVHKLSRELDEMVAEIHLPRFKAELTVLTDEQSDYTGIPINGPYKSDEYKY